MQALLEEYFASWSRGDMNAYRGCFHPRAVVYFADKERKVRVFPLAGFLLTQEQARQKARQPLEEKPVGIFLKVRGNLATALVEWRLEKGSQVITGTDLFTLIRTEEGWKILSLAFEADPAPRDPG